MSGLVRRLSDVAHGARAGLVATAAMTLLMLAGRRAGLTGELPPREIVDEAARQMPPADRTSGPDRQALAGAGHFLFGAAAGALFGLATSGLRGLWASAGLGAAYGTLVYLVSYLGWIPALGIMPPATEDRPGRQLTMLGGHWMYGILLGLLVVVGRRRARMQDQVKRSYRL